MKPRHYIVLALTAVLTLAPQAMPFVPAPYRDLASAAIAVLSSLYNLYQPPPGNGAVVSPRVASKPNAPTDINIFGA